jgi:hypothetical protein
MTSVLQALEGEPKTEVVQIKGRTIITVEAKHLPPEMARNADDGAWWGAFLMVLAPFGIGYAAEEFNALMGAIWIASACAYHPLRLFFRAASHEVATVRFTEKTIELEMGAKSRSFERDHSHRFVLLEHDRTRSENDELDYLRQRASKDGQPRRITRYFSNAYIVAFEYLGQRFDIAEVMGRKEAMAILARLNLCDEMMKSVVSTRPGVVLKPEDEWDELPGGLP